MRGDLRTITVEFNGQTKTIEGRMAWTLGQLIAAGESGCTPLTHPAPRWSDYVFKLRREGLNIETITEMHSGPYPGHHAKYVLRSTIEVLDMREAA